MTTSLLSLSHTFTKITFTPPSHTMTTVQDLFAQGSHAFADEDYEEALNWYTKAIELNATHVEIFLKR